MLRTISILLFITSFSFLHAQAQTTGSVSGCITTPDGKPIVGATVLVLGTSPQRGAIVKPDGSYTIMGVKAGEYVVQMKALGYKQERRTGVVVNAGDVTRVNVTGIPGAVSDSDEDAYYCTGGRHSYIVLGRVGTEHHITASDLDRLD